ncbi:MAG: histidine kinase [Burkholderiaceae bacterium]|nr:histidine kinase [Burkholderiaceae bacterium]
MNAATALPAAPASRWQRAVATFVRGFHAYANWLVGISWLRFLLLAVLLLIVAGILSEIPPFNLTLSERVVERPRKVVVETKPKADTPVPVPPMPPAPPGTPDAGREPLIKIERPKGSGATESVEISIGEKGIRITPRAAEPAQVASDAAARAASAASAVEQAARAADTAAGTIELRLPPGTADEVRAALEEARRELRAAADEARRDADEARRDAEEALRDAERALADAKRDAGATEVRVVKVRAGDVLPDLALVWIFGARLAAMQAQVEPHFLFNTLASIDHLIETDPPRASQMQKHLIALLRATMPTMRETQAASLRELGREMAVIRPYLELLTMRMEERLQVEIAVPAGLLTAEFPPMMLQTLVENAIKHGLEPKPEGGALRVAAEVVDGRLEVTVADTGVGFGVAGTAGTGVGLENIRERLALLYGARASLTVTANPGGGTVATIAVPYVARAKEAA